MNAGVHQAASGRRAALLIDFEEILLPGLWKLRRLS
jgi:hypothetical protein